MSSKDPTASDLARLRDASEWVQRLNESNAQARVDEWLQWCRSDPQNLPAFEQMQRIWNGFSEARDTPVHSPQPVASRRYRHRLIALAASVVVLAAAAGWFAIHYPEVQVLATAVGEQRHITLADGSRLDLAPDSRVSTRFTLLRRDVQLERGQAFFAVAHSALRPFIVHANSLTVTAVGTAFDVRIGPSRTVVTVSEGRVSVAPGADAAAGGSSVDTEAVLASVGQRVTFSKSAHRLSVANVDPKVAGSWRDGTLQFVGEPLEDVVAAVNRDSGLRIVIAPAFQQTRFTGTVSATKIRDWLNALEQIYPVEVVDQGIDGILIQSRAANGTRK
ncbi:MAG: FecR family protein [Steroidobacteraceae bacterium]